MEDLELGEGGVVGDGRSDHAAYRGLCCNIFNHIASDDSSDTAVFLEIKAVSLIPESLPEKKEIYSVFVLRRMPSNMDQ